MNSQDRKDASLAAAGAGAVAAGAAITALSLNTWFGGVFLGLLLAAVGLVPFVGKLTAQPSCA